MGALPSLYLIALLVGSLVLPMPAGAVGVLFQIQGLMPPRFKMVWMLSGQPLGNPNKLNNPGPLATGRREINWDGGGGVNTNAVAGTSFNGFLDTRGGQFTTPGTGFVQAPPAGGPQNGLAGQFANPSYATTFAAFSPAAALYAHRQKHHGCVKKTW